MTTFPTIYVSHGSPMVMLHKTPAHDFLAGFGRELGRPKAIVIATAHFTTRRPVLTGDERPEMIYDFGGFPQPLFEMTYPAPGSPELAVRGAQMLVDAGIDALPVAGRGFDHGTWVPLKLMFPRPTFRSCSSPCSRIAASNIMRPWAAPWRRCARRASS
jgi:4,5-DOPA dioxygenase extradiol